MPSSSQVWLITGCSSGFGAEITKQLLQRGDKVVATARNIAAIKPLEDLGARILQLDVTASFEDLKGKVEQAISFYGRVDVFFANAGYVHYAPVEEADIEKDIIHNMKTNTFGCTNILRTLMPHWRAQKSGFLLVNSSYMTRWSIAPGCGPYSASKAALDMLVETFNAEIETQNLGIKTLVVHPGHFRTEATNPSKFNFDRSSELYTEMDKGTKTMVDGMYQNQPGDVGKACRLIIDLVKGEGGIKGRKLPPNMPLGTDAWEQCMKETEKYLQMLKDWESVIRSTDLVPGSSAWGAKVD